MSDNRRTGTRLPAEVKVDYRTIGSFITDYTKDISKGGLFVRTSLPLEIGERVRLRITVPGGDAPFALDGVVKWVSTVRDRDKQPAGMGIEFVAFDEDTKKHIERLVKTYSESGEPKT